MSQAGAYAGGLGEAARAHPVPVTDTSSIREAYGLTQRAFAYRLVITGMARDVLRGAA